MQSNDLLLNRPLIINGSTGSTSSPLQIPKSNFSPTTPSTVHQWFQNDILRRKRFKELQANKFPSCTSNDSPFQLPRDRVEALIFHALHMKKTNKQTNNETSGEAKMNILYVAQPCMADTVFPCQKRALKSSGMNYGWISKHL